MSRVRRIYSMDKDWSFRIGEIEEGIENAHCDIYSHSKAGSCRGVPKAAFNVSGWETVTLPHDWSVKTAFDKNATASWGYKTKGNAWYRKAFYLDESFDNKQLLLTFDGVAKNATVYFNGSVLKRNYTSYAPFCVDITDRAHFGGEPNVLAVYVEANGWEGWWYEGAGIYRHVTLEVKDKTCVARYGVFVKPEKQQDCDDWNVIVEITLNNHSYDDDDVEVTAEIFDEYNNPVVVATEKVDIKAYSDKTLTLSGVCSSPNLWDIDSPHMYKCLVSISRNGECVDDEEVSFGFRTIEVSAEKGFFLNGRSVKLYGTCNHQDHGGIGVAVPDSLHEYRIKKLKSMGSNAYRCAHGMPHKELLDACDKLGMLVMDENRNFETGDDYLCQLREMVLRDRNHPSVVMYSLFNEEPLQSGYDGQRMVRHMRAEVHKLDNTRFVTGAMHGGVLEDSGAASALDICGINYQMWTYNEFPKKFPNVPVVASETTSYFAVRGCLETDLNNNLLSDYDEESSDWGATVRHTWQEIMPRDYIMGGFMWTGFDYLGEPTPCVWPSVSSFFGMMDVCGFEKSGYWVSKAIFSKEPVCHLLPHWNHKGKEGKPIKVMSCTNCPQAELFLNGTSLGVKQVDKLHQTCWEVPFEEGEIRLVGYDERGKTLAEHTVVTSGEVVSIKVLPSENTIYNDGTDAIPVDFIAVDEIGNEVYDANFIINIYANGGEIIGTSNGNPNCHEPFDSPKRSIFNGRCQAIVRCNAGSEKLIVGCTCDEYKLDCSAVVDCQPRETMTTIESVNEIYLSDWKLSSELSDEKPDADIRISDSDMNTMEPVSVFETTGKFYKNVGKYGLYRCTANIPETLGDTPCTIKFYSLWGECDVWIGGKLIAQLNNYWAEPLEIPVTQELIGKKEISVVVKCINESGAGIGGGVVIR